MTRILIADGRELVRSDLRAILEGRAGWEIVAEPKNESISDRGDFSGLFAARTIDWEVRG